MKSLRPVLFVGFLAIGTLGGAMVQAQTPAQSSVPLQTKLESKAVVRAFMEALYLRDDPDAAGALLAPIFLEHSPLLEPVPESTSPMPVPDPKPQTPVIYTLEQVLAEGDWVTTLLRVNEAGYPAYYFVDLFRVQGGLIVEHWDSSAPASTASSQGLGLKGKPSFFGKPKPK